MEMFEEKKLFSIVNTKNKKIKWVTLNPTHCRVQIWKNVLQCTLLFPNKLYYYYFSLKAFNQTSLVLNTF